MISAYAIMTEGLHTSQPSIGSTERHKLVVREDALAPLQLFDRRADPLEDRNAVDLAEYRSTVEELMDTHVRPFFKVGPQRPHPPTIRTR